MSETIISRRIRQNALFGDRHITSICLLLRGELNGSIDSMYPGVLDIYNFLKMVVDTWQPNLTGNRLDAQLDDCVLQMVKTTIELVEANYPENLR